MKTKIVLMRLKSDSSKVSQNAPDYEAIFTTSKGDFYAVGWLNDFSDLSLTIEKIDLSKENFNNKFFIKKYAEYKSPVLKEIRRKT